MTDISELHAQALDATGRIVRGVAADRWHAATPCAGWDARALVSHLVAGNLWAAELAAGGTIGGVGSRLDGDLLGDDPAAAYGESAAAAAAVFRRPGALDAPCAVSYGPVPGSVYAGHRFLDVLVHGWDLAVATGQDYALDPHLMDACGQIIEPQLEAFRSAGALGPEVAVPADASAQTRFLALLGRTGCAGSALRCSTECHGHGPELIPGSAARALAGRNRLPRLLRAAARGLDLRQAMADRMTACTLLTRSSA